MPHIQEKSLTPQLIPKHNGTSKLIQIVCYRDAYATLFWEER